MARRRAAPPPALDPRALRYDPAEWADSDDPVSAWLDFELDYWREADWKMYPTGLHLVGARGATSTGYHFARIAARHAARVLESTAERIDQHAYAVRLARRAGWLPLNEAA